MSAIKLRFNLDYAVRVLFNLKAILMLCCYQECVKVSVPAYQVLPLMVHISEASYSTSATQANKIYSMDLSELLNL